MTRCVRRTSFGFNGKLELQYRGRLDASRKEAAPADARRELFEAMRAGRRDGEGTARADVLHGLLHQVEGRVRTPHLRRPWNAAVSKGEPHASRRGLTAAPQHEAAAH